MLWPEPDRWRAPVGDFPPRWASAWGDDRYGLWAELTVRGVTQRMRWIEPTGREGFWMGSTPEQAEAALRVGVAQGFEKRQMRGWLSGEMPRHVVRLTRGFWLADTPCTQAFWQAVTGTNPSHFKDSERAAERPVEEVSWDDVQGDFVEGVLRAGIPVDRGQITLPTEAEWEYACRAGGETAYHWGDEFDESRANVNVKGSLGETSEVKRYEANGWGLYDMHGNVWEWCLDGKREYEGGEEEDPRGPEGASRVLRGGSWYYPPVVARSAFRSDAHPGYRPRRIGFRFALRSASPGPGGPGTRVGGVPTGGGTP